MQVKYKNKTLFDKIQDKNKKYFGIVGLGVGNYKITTERGDVSIGSGSASSVLILRLAEVHENRTPGISF
jgi:hypothetical protein